LIPCGGRFNNCPIAAEIDSDDIAP